MHIGPIRKWMFVLGLVSLGLVSLGLGACQRFYVETRVDPAVSFANYKTYSFSNEAGDVPEGFATGHLFNSIMQRRIRAELYRDLTQKGFQQVARSDASFIVSFSTAGRQDVQPLDVGATKSSENTVEGSATVVNRGALVIHFIDPKTRRTLWRGWAEAVMHAGEDLDDKVRAAVREIMHYFPPRAG